MRFAVPLIAFLLTACATTSVPTPAERAEQWWADVATLADDDMEGRLTGSAGYRRAADYVVSRFRQIGLEPAGSDGFLQPIAFEEQFVGAAQSRASLVRAGGAATPLEIPGDLIIGSGAGPRPAAVDAPLVFIGYGLHLPEAGHDDFANIDLRGKIAVVVGGGPASISGALKSHARSQRARLLEERGAVGLIALTTPKAVEIPWARTMGLSSQGGMYFSDPALREIRTEFVSGSFNPARSEMMFAASGRSFADIAALADASRPVPGVDLKQSLRATIATRRTSASSPNVVALLKGSDPTLRAEHVVLSAHLDHLGVGEPINGDRIFNGAMDNAAGVGTLLDIARVLKQRRVAPKRSILFVIVTAEEKGLLGSRYFTLRPTVPRRSIVANLNFDMALPIIPLTSVIALGSEESSLGADARAIGEALGLPVLPDPLPERNSFTRSDQYSFVREGVPALAFKFGFTKGSPEAAVEQAWRSGRYHAPSDDLAQPVQRADAVRLNDFVAALAARIADTPARPSWLPQSFFRRFAKE